MISKKFLVDNNLFFINDVSYNDFSIPFISYFLVKKVEISSSYIVVSQDVNNKNIDVLIKKTADFIKSLYNIDKFLSKKSYLLEDNFKIKLHNYITNTIQKYFPSIKFKTKEIEESIYTIQKGKIIKKYIFKSKNFYNVKFSFFNFDIYKKTKNYIKNNKEYILFNLIKVKTKPKNEEKKEKVTFYEIKNIALLLYKYNKCKYFNPKETLQTDLISLPEGIGIDTSYNNSLVIFNPSIDVLKTLEDTFIIFWGRSEVLSLHKKDIFEDLLEKANKNNNKIIFAEDSFVNNILFFSYKGRVNKKYTDHLSFVLDDMGYHFCPYSPTRIEQILSSSKELSEIEKERAIRNMNFIIDNHISKYNYKPIKTGYKLPGDNKKKVLVIGQRINDASVTNSNVSSNIFDIILKSAFEENKNADILVLEHPETKFLNLPKNYNMTNNRIHFIEEDVSVAVLLEKVDKVYVCSSGVGLEAIIRGKETVVFGAPFYAGWGLTDDRNDIFKTPEMLERRNKKLTKEEIFYRTYIDYTFYQIPGQSSCEIEDVLNYLIKIREEFFIDIKNGNIIL